MRNSKLKEGCRPVAGFLGSAFAVIAKTVVALLSLYLFICSLTFLSSSFRILGGKNLSSLFESNLLSNPVVGVMIGEITTVITGLAMCGN